MELGIPAPMRVPGTRVFTTEVYPKVRAMIQANS
jgi:hypothetical protein